MKKILFQNKILTRSILGMFACAMFFFFGGFVSEAAEGKVTANTAKVRKEASTDSEVIGSTTKGKKVDIVGAEKDSSGMVWYKVPNGNNTYGYIRSDLMETSDTIEVTSASASTSSSENTSKPDPTVPTAIGEQKATITQSSVRVRSGASTKHDAVGSLTEGTEITLIGEANDSAGNKWYQIRCDAKNMEGYIRSDLISISEAPESNEGESTEGENTEGENVEGENPEGEAETPIEEAPVAEPEHNDYEIVYNEDQYWLYLNTNGTMMKVEDLLNVVNTANENNEKLQNEIKSNKIIVVILAVIIVILVIAVTVLIFKLRDLYYGDYEEDEEEEEEEEEPVPVKKRKRKLPEEEEELVPVKRKRPAAEEPLAEKKERPAKAREAQATAELKAAEKKQPERKQTSRKAQNFLLDDDEFEFEFLNMDDKDL